MNNKGVRTECKVNVAGLVLVLGNSQLFVENITVFTRSNKSYKSTQRCISGRWCGERYLKCMNLNLFIFYESKTFVYRTCYKQLL